MVSVLALIICGLADQMWYLSRERCWSGGGASGVTWRVGKRLAGLQRRLLLLSHNLLGGWKTADIQQWFSNNQYLHIHQSSSFHPLTFWKHSVNVEAVGGAGLVKQRVTHINAQLPGPLVLNYPWVDTADFICNKKTESLLRRAFILGWSMTLLIICCWFSFWINQSFGPVVPDFAFELISNWMLFNY